MFSTENVIPPLGIDFRYHKLSETKEPPNEIYLADKKFSISYCDTPSVVNQTFCNRQNGSTGNIDKHQKLPENQKGCLD